MLLRIWDLPTRVFHWALALAVLGLVVTGNVGGDAMVWHMRLGYAVLTLVAFRLLWGVVGGYWSRFVQFPLGLPSVLRYVRGGREPRLHWGHNPLGSWAVVAMLLALALQAVAGLMVDDEIAYAGPLTSLVSGDMVQLATWYHKQVGKFVVLGLVVLHLLAVAFHSVALRERLVPAMWHGNKVVDSAGAPASEDNGRRRAGALVLAVVCAALVAALVWYGNRHDFSAFG
jgi:cytochrome b